MVSVIHWIEESLTSLPFPLLELWGQFAYLVGLVLAVCAYTGFTFRLGSGWGLGRERQAWDSKAILSIPLTFILILVTGYVGSFIVLVPGAQTFESLKDLMVFLCICLFGYPALLTVPFAYGLSDLIEGVPPEFLLDWLPGYFINPSCFWIAYQLIGRNPDFRRANTWGLYLLFVVLFLGVEPLLWGHICAGKFTPEISYRNISSALFFTTALTWLLAPFAMLCALPLARRYKLFWAEIPGHVKVRRWGETQWIWQAGSAAGDVLISSDRGTPLRVMLLAPFVGLVLAMVGITAFVALRSAEGDANRLAERLHEEISKNIDLLLDAHFTTTSVIEMDTSNLQAMLSRLPVAQHGLVILLDSDGRVIASSRTADDAVSRLGVETFRVKAADRDQTLVGRSFRFHHVTEKPLGRMTWYAHVSAYDRSGRTDNWAILIAMPENYYLAGVKAGNSRTAMVVAIALLLSLGVAAVLSALVTRGLRRISLAAQSLAGMASRETTGQLSAKEATQTTVPSSRVEELDLLARSFNEMAERLAKSFERLQAEVETRKSAENALRELNESLEKIVAERTEALQTALLRAESADRVKSDFLATMSHELRTPLNSIIGFSGIVMQGLAGPLTDEQARQIAMVRDSARHLLELINDVLDLSRLEANQLAVVEEPFDLRQSLERVLASVQPQAEKKGLRLSAEIAEAPGTMHGDRRRVEQIVLNLLNNAIKFTESGVVTLSVNYALAHRFASEATPCEAIGICVKDTGIGIAAEDLQRLFQPFHQIDSGLNRKHEGTGLGLAICRRLAGLMSGEIAVESVLGEGSRFSLILPVRTDLSTRR